MRLVIVSRATILGVLILGLAGCSQGKQPFRMVQFCLAGPQEIPAFTSFMNEIAQSYRMNFLIEAAKHMMN